MATSTMVPLEEYLRTSYEPDCEWVNGVVKQRGMPDGYHGYFQSFFLVYFQGFKETLRALLQVRIEISPRTWRVPEVMVISADARFLPLPTETPLVCIEILSPDDRVSDLQQKIDDYVARGVGAIWILDPRRRTMSIADSHGTHRVQEFSLAGTPVRITADDLFADLDRLEALSD